MGLFMYLCVHRPRMCATLYRLPMVAEGKHHSVEPNAGGVDWSSGPRSAPWRWYPNSQGFSAGPSSSNFATIMRSTGQDHPTAPLVAEANVHHVL